ncbi:MAG: cyclic nucleotide-binding domain-containing protein [Terriglobales bacterium]
MPANGRIPADFCSSATGFPQTGQTLFEPNEPIEYGYFPNSGMASIVAIMGDGATVEVGIAGKEGFVGTPILLGVRPSHSARLFNSAVRPSDRVQHVAKTSPEDATT